MKLHRKCRTFLSFVAIPEAYEKVGGLSCASSSLESLSSTKLLVKQLDLCNDE